MTSAGTYGSGTAGRLRIRDLDLAAPRITVDGIVIDMDR
jgi:hypothetical protein